MLVTESVTQFDGKKFQYLFGQQLRSARAVSTTSPGRLGTLPVDVLSFNPSSLYLRYPPLGCMYCLYQLF